MLIEVAFKGNRKEFFTWAGDPDAFVVRSPVVVEADRGEDVGYVLSLGDAAEHRATGVPHRPDEGGVTQTVRRAASASDLRKLDEIRAQDESARKQSIERVRTHKLAMKVTDAEWRWDRRKLTLYFTSEKRVDFRNLVRELATLFKTRIELKQIGVRDEARRLGGIGRCGREYCSAAWLPDLRPVNLGVARDQRLSLNPTQISGACGRLMCCLRFEHDFYIEQRRRFPKEGRIIETSLGEEKVMSCDIFRERVTLRNVEGDTRIVPLVDLRKEWKHAPAANPQLDEETATLPIEGLSDELLRLQDTAEMPAYMGPGERRADRRRLPVVADPPDAPTAPPEHSSAPVKPTTDRSALSGHANVSAPRAPDSGPQREKTSDGPAGTNRDDAKGEVAGRRRRGRRGGRRNRGGSGGAGGNRDDQAPDANDGNERNTPPSPPPRGPDGPSGDS